MIDHSTDKLFDLYVEQPTWPPGRVNRSGACNTAQINYRVALSRQYSGADSVYTVRLAGPAC